MPDQRPGLDPAYSSSPGLLSTTILFLVMFASVIVTVLNVLGMWRQSDLEGLTLQERNRYLNVREEQALKTFERAILAVEPVNAPEPETLTAELLLQGLPECRREWDDGPVWYEQLYMKLSDGNIRTSTAERMASSLTALETYLEQLPKGGNRRVLEPVRLDRQRWFKAVQTDLRQEFVSHLPSSHGPLKFRMGCRDVATAVSTLVPKACRQTLLSLGDDTKSSARMRQECRSLESLNWRDTTVSRSMRDEWRRLENLGIPARVAVPPSMIVRRNPWQGVPGCVYWQDSTRPQVRYYLSDSARRNRRVCEHPEVLGEKVVTGSVKKGVLPLAAAGRVGEGTSLADPRWSVPPSLHLILRPIDALRLPGSATYEAYTSHRNLRPAAPERYGYGENVVLVGGRDVDAGFSADLTIDARTQALAQQVAACYTGNQAVCRELNIERREDKGKAIGHKLLEDALVRMAGIAIIDIETGRIEAAAGALSPCTRQDYDGPGRDSSCEGRLPWKPAYKPDMLENPAFFHDAMPGSTIKPIMAAAFLADGDYGARLLGAEMAAIARGGAPQGGLRRELMFSKSARFLDRMFCLDGGRDPVDCRRIWAVQAAANTLGWNSACGRGDGTAGAGRHCGRWDVLFGRTPGAVDEDGLVVPDGLPVMFGRLMVEPAKEKGQVFALMAPAQLNTDQVRVCGAGHDGRRGTLDDWEKCRGGAVADVVAEGWGQGHARSTPVGVAGMMAMLGAAANGMESWTRPHLITALRGSGNAAEGTSVLRTPERRWQREGVSPIKVPRDAARVILDGLSWSHRGGTATRACDEVRGGKDACAGISWIAGKTGTPTFHYDGKTLADIDKECRARPEACSTLRPYKWYTAVFRLDHGTRWQKAIAVLAERNWDRASGKVGVGDTGPNPAAEIAFQIVGRLRTGHLPVVAKH